MSYATSNGIDFYYDEQGEGKPLVLLHGGIGSGEMFAPLTPALAAAGRRVIAVDLQGHGRTADVDRPFARTGYADELRRRITPLGRGDQHRK
jgi:pimeloyl-ACP methyl ester carboxylesterase